MKYWYSPEDKSLTQNEIDLKVEELWTQVLNESKNCPDCGVKSGEVHKCGCDVARCISCNEQAITCGCDNVEYDKWSGLWPGVKECYEQKLIVWSDPNKIGGTGWTFDLNELAIRK